MPIEKNIQYGKHEGVTLCHFGYGDIGVSTAKETPESGLNMIVLNQVAPRPLMDIEEYPPGTNTEQVEQIAVVMYFDRPESITTLVQALLEVQRNLFIELQKQKI